jgi:hypothetical protein
VPERAVLVGVRLEDEALRPVVAAICLIIDGSSAVRRRVRRTRKPTLKPMPEAQLGEIRITERHASGHQTLAAM